MEITRENTGELTATIKMVISPADHKENVTKILKDYQRKANVPGFRPGHVPFGMIKKLYGSAVFAEEVNKLVSEKLQKYVVDEKLDILGQPLPNVDLSQQFDHEEEKDIEFFFDLGMAPAFDVVLDENLAIDYHVIKVDNTMIDKYVDDMRERFGTMDNQEIAGEKDMLHGNFKQLDAEGNVLEDGISHSSRLSIDSIADEELKAKLIGSKVSDTLVFNPAKATRTSVEVAAMLGIDKAEAEGLDSDFSFEITEITTAAPAEMNEEFFEKVFPESGITTEEDFRRKIQDESEKAFVADSDHLFAHHSQEKLVETLNIPLPDAFMKRWLVESNEGKISQEEIDLNYDKYAEGMKWQLIENKIIKDAEIEVADQEIKDYVKDYYLQGWRTMQLNEDLMKRLETIADSFLKDKPTETRRIIDSLYGQRVTAYIKSKVKLVEKEITYDEFVKIDAEKH